MTIKCAYDIISALRFPQMPVGVESPCWAWPPQVGPGPCVGSALCMGPGPCVGSAFCMGPEPCTHGGVPAWDQVPVMGGAVAPQGGSYISRWNLSQI